MQLANNYTQRTLIQPSFSVIIRKWALLIYKFVSFGPRDYSQPCSEHYYHHYTLHYSAPRKIPDSVDYSCCVFSSHQRLVVVDSVHPFAGGVERTLEMRHRRDPVTHHFDLVLAAGDEVVGHRQTVGSPHVPANVE